MQIKNNYDIYWEKGSRNDLRTYESGTGVFNGEYHVLNGLISPMDGVDPEDIELDKLIFKFI